MQSAVCHASYTSMTVQGVAMTQRKGDKDTQDDDTSGELPPDIPITKDKETYSRPTDGLTFRRKPQH